MRGASRRGYEHSTRVPPAVEQEDGAEGFGRDAEFFGGLVVEHVWVGCQTERLKVKFDFGLEGVESGYCAVARHTCGSYGFKD